MIKIILSLAIVVGAAFLFYNLGFSNGVMSADSQEIVTYTSTTPEKTHYGSYDNISQEIIINSEGLDTYQTFYVMMHEGFHHFYDGKYDLVVSSGKNSENERLASAVLDDFECKYNGTEPELIEYFYEICEISDLYD